MSRSYTDKENPLDQVNITGEVLNITYRSEESGWTVFKIHCEEENKAVTAMEVSPRLMKDRIYASQVTG